MSREPSFAGQECASAFQDIECGLLRLDKLLALAVGHADGAFGPDARTDPYRGLHLASDDVARLLDRAPGHPLLWTAAAPWLPPAGSPFGWLAESYGLTGFDLDVVLLALAPEIDSRYERLYAYLQDDISRRRPSIDLALHLLCSNASDRLARRRHFAVDAPLFEHAILVDPGAATGDSLGTVLRLDPQVTAVLIGADVMDRRVQRWSVLNRDPGKPEVLPLGEAEAAAFARLITRCLEEGAPARLALIGPPGSGRDDVASAFARETARSLLLLDLHRLIADGGDLRAHFGLVLREAWFRDAVLVIRGAEALLDRECLVVGLRLQDVARDHPGSILLLADAASDTGVELGAEQTILLGIPDAGLRQRLWAAKVPVDQVGGAPTVEQLSRFRLLPGQINSAATLAASVARARAGDEPLEAGDLFAAARAQTGHALAALARRRRARRTWSDLILPEDELAQLRELCARARNADRVLDSWAFAATCAGNRGTAALFSGPPGTGKTTAAEVIAHELRVDLFRVDLARVVSKWIGETEKNLDRIFAAAENANGVLFFDEADALFGKRSEVRDAHDRFANIEVSYLLQKLEEYDGLTILATNLRANLDDAFLRRLAFVVHFPFPDADSRQRIWEATWPSAAPLTAEVDLARLAERFPLSGGGIRNAALAAAYTAAANGGTITSAYVHAAIRREYQKLGRQLSDVEWDAEFMAVG